MRSAQIEQFLTKCSQAVPCIGGVSAAAFTIGLVLRMFPSSGMREIGGVITSYAIWPLLAALAFIIFGASATPRRH